jgi:hypothetical protein
VLAAALIPAGSALAQDLAPDVLLLSRVRRHVKEELQHLPNISCLETVQREHKALRGKMQPLDTVRLEVRTDGSKELFASPGDRHFSERPPISYVGSGTMGDGYFGLHLKTVLGSDKVTYIYKGEEDSGGRRLVRWDYRLPQIWSGQSMHLQEGSGTVGLLGSFWADPATFDIARLLVIADDFPPSLPVAAASWRIDYARTKLASDLSGLLPESAEFRMEMLSGVASHSIMGFTQCRIFGAQSTISFDSPIAGLPDAAAQPRSFGISGIDDTLRTLPGGLEIPVTLRSRVAGDFAVGALIAGVVANDVRNRDGVAIAAGTPVRGRLRRLEHYEDPIPHFVIALEYTELELSGIRYRFDANLVRIEPAAGVELTLTDTQRVDIGTLGHVYDTRIRHVAVTFSDLPGVATFFFRGASLDLRAGLKTIWMTRPSASARAR